MPSAVRQKGPVDLFEASAERPCREVAQSPYVIEETETFRCA